ncbi:MAG: type IV pilin protein [Candidatus Eisenbacteria bacterium]
MNRFRRKSGQKGFTMIELMVVVVIVGVLAAIAIPVYGRYVKNSRVTEATGRLGEIVTSGKAWAQEHVDANTSHPTWPDQTDATGLDRGVMDMTGTDNFDYAIESAHGDATTGEFQVRATGKAKMAGVQVLMEVPNIGATGTVSIPTGL